MPSVDRKVGVSYGKCMSIPKLWPGSTIFVIGGGPSISHLVGQNWLDGKIVIAVHHSIKVILKPSVWFCADTRAYWELQDIINAFEGFKVSLNIRTEEWKSVEGHGNINVINQGKGVGLSDNPRCLCYNQNGGGTAIDLAYHFGAKRIILLGFDCNQANAKDSYSSHTRQKTIVPWQNSSVCQKLDNSAKSKGVDIINCTPNSGLPIIRRGNLKDEI